MIRGALILAVGFSLGYSKAIRDSDEIRELLRELIEEMKHFPPDPEPQDAKAEEVVEAIEVPAEPDTEDNKGETP